MDLMLKNLCLKIIVRYLLIAVLPVCFARSLFACVRQNPVSQFGITWTFDKEYTVGQFANGDYWVIGPVTIVGINPASVELNGRVINGSMINPSPRLGQRQGYDGAMYGRFAKWGGYEPNLNVARPNNGDLSNSNPLVLQPGSSLVSAISVPRPGDPTVLQTAAILTILGNVPLEGSFRPPYSGTDKTVRFNKSQLDYSLLAHLKPVPGSPSLSTVERTFERPWLDHVPNWPNSCLHPVDNMPVFGRELATEVGVGALMLNLNFTNERKEKLFIRYVQLGIDLYGIVKDGGEKNWISNGAHNSGRKLPILFAGLVLNDPNMKNIGRADIPDYGPSHPEYVHFGEDDQTFYVTQADVEATHSSQWNPDNRDTQKIPYEQEDIGLPEWGIIYATDPLRCNKFWNTAYRRVSCPSWGGFVLAAHIMGAKDLWNHDALFDFKDRYMQATPDWRQMSKFVEAMWDTYRKNYGPVWTMSPTLNLVADGGSVVKIPDKEAYALGESVRLRAVPDPGYEFTNWSGGFSGTENPVTIIMHAKFTITANFTVASKSPK
jgi:hypothetical protein